MKLITSLSLIGITLIIASSPPASAADKASLQKLEAQISRKSADASKSLDLSGADMRPYNLCGSKNDAKIDFRKANLAGANFSGMDISYVDFGGANLDKDNFEGATISKCNFRYAKGRQTLRVPLLSTVASTMESLRKVFLRTQLLSL